MKRLLDLELEGFLQGRQAEEHSWLRCVLCGERCRNALYQVIWKKDCDNSAANLCPALLQTLRSNWKCQ